VNNPEQTTTQTTIQTNNQITDQKSDVTVSNFKTKNNLKDNNKTTNNSISFSSKTSKKSQVIAIIALVLSLFSAFGVIALFWFNKNNLNADITTTSIAKPMDFSRRINYLVQQNQKINLDISNQNNQINQLNKQLQRENIGEQRRLIATLQEDTQVLHRKLERTFNASRDNWHLAEAESLVRLAVVRANALHDPSSALILLKTADDILFKQDDPASFAAREQLNKAIAQLKILAQVDITGVYLKIAALHNLIADLDIAPQFNNLPNDSGQEYEDWWQELSQNIDNLQHWKQKFSNYVRIDFSNNKDNRRIIASHNVVISKLELSLSLKQAQLALLNANQEIYTQALQQAKYIIDNNFIGNNQAVRSFNSSLQDLIAQKITFVMPDLNLSLSAIQNYLSFKHNLRSEQQNTNQHKNNTNIDNINVERE